MTYGYPWTHATVGRGLRVARDEEKNCPCHEHRIRRQWLEALQHELRTNKRPGPDKVKRTAPVPRRIRLGNF